jgi:RNA polymerase sigma-70 factor, ECF subfamily
VNTVVESVVNTPEMRLVDLAAAGDREARRALFEQHREQAFRVALRITGRPEDALDVVQDSFIRAFERLRDFERGSGFKTWFLRIVSNRALDLLRSRKVRIAVPLDASGGDDSQRDLFVPDATPPPGEQLERRELGARLRRAIDTLPPDQRAVFALYALGELTYAQIADVLGVPIGTVMSRLFHARRRLHKLLPDLAPPEAEPAPTAARKSRAETENG